MIKEKYFIHNRVIKSIFLVCFLLISIAPCLIAETIIDVYIRGLRSGQQGEVKAAELHFKNALAINPFYIPARRALDIINDFQQGLVDSVNAAILFNGTEYFRKAEFTDAINEFEKAVKNVPNYYLAHHNLGTAYYEDGQNAKAITQYKEALKLNPRYSYTHNNLGLAYVRSNRPYKAIEHYKRAIDIDPTYHKAYNNLGVALFKINKIDEAKAMFQKAVKVNPNYTLGYSNFLREYQKEDFKVEEIKDAQDFSLEELLKQIEKGDWRERKIAAQALALRGNSSIIQPLLKLMKHSNPLVRATAVKILGDIKVNNAVNALINYIDEEKDWSVRWEMVRALSKMKDPGAVDALHRCLLEDSDYHIRLDAAYALYYLRDPRSIEPLDKALQDRIPEVRKAALWVLAYGFDKNGYYQGLLEEQKKNKQSIGSPDGEQQDTDLNSLLLNGEWDRMIQLGEPAVDFLIEIIEKGDPNLRIDAVIGLGYLGNQKAVDALIKLLENRNADIRFYAAEALGKTNNKTAVPALIRALSDPHWKVKGQAADSLRRITNQFLGDDPEEWQKWWQEYH
ncbi:MAG: HEAT repeat domain-containing protein [Candidatus Aminicenantes bacterium]|jgi:HEAT repeat protein